MRELKILELLIVLLLALFLLRSFIKGLWPLEGLTLLPAFALAITMALFPAYGIRPECLPLLVYGVVLNCFNIPSFLAILGRLKNDDFLDCSPLRSGIFLGLLVITGAIALYFAPADTMDLRSRDITSAVLRDEGRDVEFWLRIYGGPEKAATQGTRPLLILLPPAAFSISAVDDVCAALAEKGFTVLAYSRRGVDAPAFDETGRRRWLSPARSIRLLQAIANGTRTAAANARGRFWEEERGRDLRFLLSALQRNPDMLSLLPPDTARNRIFLVGYGAGGAAVTVLGGDLDFMARNPAIQGLISIEGPVLSILQKESPRQYTLSQKETGWVPYIRGHFTAALANLGPVKITGIESGSLKAPAVPVLYIVSDRVMKAKYRDGRYSTIVESFRIGPTPALIAAVPGASPLDYSDLPVKYPLLKFLIPGEGKPVWAGEEYPRNTAALIANFAVLVLAGKGNIARTVLSGDISVEVNRTWNLGNAGYILGL
jgi:dienelactone hydrolase